MTGYYDLVGVEAAMAALEAAYPGLCVRIPLIHLSIENRQTHAIRINDPSAGANHGVLITSCLHANELGGAEIVLGFASDLLGAYTAQTGLAYGQKTFTRDEVNTVMRSVDVIIYPVVNPDGRVFCQSGNPNWRKNRNPGPNGTVGVDINRNFGFLWNHMPPGMSPEPPGSRSYAGASADSERETKNLQFLVDTHPNIRRLLDIHSDGEHVLWGWSHDELQSTDPAMNFMNAAFNGQRGALFDGYKEYMPATHQAKGKLVAAKVADAIAAVRGKQYALLGDANKYYPNGVFGLATDYFYSRHLVNPTTRLIQTWGIEFGTETPVSSWPEMEQIMADVGAGICAFCLDAAPKFGWPHAEVTPAWADWVNLAAEVVRVSSSVAAGGSGTTTPRGGPPEPVPPPVPELRALIDQLNALVDALTGQSTSRDRGATSV